MMRDDVTRLTNSFEAIKVAEISTELPPSFDERSRRLALACRAAAAQACPSRSPSPGRRPRGNSSPSMPDNEQKTPADADSYQVAEELAARLAAMAARMQQ